MGQFMHFSLQYAYVIFVCVPQNTSFYIFSNIYHKHFFSSIFIYFNKNPSKIYQLKTIGLLFLQKNVDLQVTSVKNWIDHIYDIFQILNIFIFTLLIRKQQASVFGQILEYFKNGFICHHKKKKDKSPEINMYIMQLKFL